MKKGLLLFVVVVMYAAMSLAQTPQKMTYQAVVRDAQGTLVSNSNIGVRISIVQGGADGSVVYSQTETLSTNANGLFTTEIGGVGFGSIDWSSGQYFIKSEVDPVGGDNYILVTVQQLLSVPYALHAHTADSITGSVNISESDPVFSAWDKNYNDLTNKPAIPTVPTNVSAFTNDAGYLTSAEVPTNVSAFTNDAGYLTSYTESQILTIVHDTIFLTGGSYVKLPAGFSGDYNDLINKPATPSVPTNVSAFTNDAGYITSAVVPTNVSAFTNDAGYLTSYTESQILTIVHDTIYLTGGSYVKLPAGFSGDYNDLTNKPTIPTVPTNVSDLTNDAGYLTSYTESQILTIGHDTVFLTGGSYVKLPAGFSGDYNDLINKPAIPTVPTNVSAFINDAGYLTSAEVPTNVSDLTNDAGYLTSYTESQSLASVTAIGNAAHSQLKEVSDPSESMDAVNLRTLDAVIADLTHRFDSLANRFDSITSYQENLIRTMDAMLVDLSGFDVNGTSKATFSVADGRAVHFSHGNLQYQASTGTWRFAEKQYDVIGAANSNISSSYTGWIDLFAWGTSGWNSGADEYQPWTSSDSYEGFMPGGNDENDLVGEYANADWGVYNRILNGGNQPGLWRTLTGEEWEYLIETRSASTVSGTADARFAKATVCGMTGVVVFPDSFFLPDGLVVTNVNEPSRPFNSNVYNSAQWVKMESAGAVFLPAAGARSGSSVSNVGARGFYWASTNAGVYDASVEFFYNSGLYLFFDKRKYGMSVRLVRDSD